MSDDSVTTSTTDQDRASRLMVLMFTDVEGSVDMKRQLGDAAFAKLISQHDTLFLSIVNNTPGGEVLKDVGDGFLARFVTPSDAVAAALQFQYALNHGGWEPVKLKVRIGLHLGEVTELDEDIDGQRKVIGLTADIAARIMGLAQGGQILLTHAAFDAARQYVRQHPPIKGHAGELPAIRWMAYGRYKVKGVEDSMEVFEVGAEGISPLTPPPDTEKARRAVSEDEEETLGWRPAAGLEIPRRSGWIIERKLGEGGFGEVWLGRHGRTADHRVFKFCFDVERLRSFKRELTLFRMIRTALGDRKDIARLHEVQLESPPYFLESEFSEKGNLADWAASIGGIDTLPLDVRVDLVARIADAVAAAHSVGILHKDIKPQNVLVQLDEHGKPRPILADFGIGVVTDVSRLENMQITGAGFTETILADNDSTRTGTRMYMPPESLADRPFTVQGDIFALGVLLYQLVVGDLKKPLGGGWERDVPDELLQEDIAACVEGDPSRRLSSARDLAQRLRELSHRRHRAQREAQAVARQLKRRKLVKFAVVGMVVLGIALASVAFALIRETGLRRRAELAETQALATSTFLRSMLETVNPNNARADDFSLRQLLDAAADEVGRQFADQPEIKADLQNTIGVSYYALGRFTDAQKQLKTAFETRKATLGAEHPATLDSMHHYATVLAMMNKGDEAIALKRQVVELRRKVLGPDHRDTLRSLDSLATSLYYTGDRIEGENLRGEVYEARLRFLGENDPDTLSSMATVAQQALVANELIKAETLYAKVLELRTAALGENHPDTLSSVTALARTLSARGKHAEAEELLVKVVAALERKFGAEHLSTLMARSTLASTLLDQGRAAEAETTFRAILKIQEATLPPNHWATMRSMSSLGDALMRQAKVSEAEQAYRAVLVGRQATLPKGHRFIIETMRQLAYALQEEGKDAEAQSLLKEAEELEKVRSQSMTPRRP
ncbi:MAG: tetratricopeptide repeat protein [Phycisphaeraceae bacterium]